MTAWLLSLMSLAFVMSVTPGPNNLIFAASGARVGYGGTVPVLGGMIVGFGLVIALCGAGIGAAVGESRAVQLALSLVAASYMGWLAVKLWAAGELHVAPEERPTTALQMLLLQGLNPKTWLASVAFVSGYLGFSSPGGLAVDLVGVGCFLSVVLVSASLWTMFGAALRRRLRGRSLIVFHRSLSVLAAATALSMVPHPF